MQLLLRKITHDAEGQAEYLDSSVDGDVITIGSAPSCDIQILGLGVGPIHARLQKSGAQILLSAEKNSQFVHQDQQVRKAQLKPGDKFSIGGQEFACVEPPAGFDLTLEWYFAAVPGHLLENAYRTSIDQLHFSMRLVSWFLVLLVVLFAGLAPIADYRWRTDGVSIDSGSVGRVSIDGIAENNLLENNETENNVERQEHFSQQQFSALARPMADSFWLSGPLLPAHEVAIGDQCEACHRQPFVQVQDQACNACHIDIKDHVNAIHPDAGSFSEFRCQNCHKEHNEPVAVVSRSDRLCNQCHADQEPKVSEFSSSGHPEFAPTLLTPQVEQASGLIDITWQPIKAKLDQASTETNHLIYPHDIHLDPTAVTHQQRGDGLQCADCHVLQADGEHFAPITMEQHCADCHDLSFDLNNPQQQLPHGEPPAVFAALKAHFVGLAFNPIDRGFERRRLPGKTTVDESCEKDYGCALRQTRREAEKQFLQSGCVTCHEVKQLVGAEGGDQWQVMPVKLSQDWYASANFDHRSHLTPSDFTEDRLRLDQGHSLEQDSDGNGVCLTCHDAANSATSADVLMPVRAQCTNCHGNSADGGFFLKRKVALNCISCHGYHRGDAFQ